MRIGLLTDGGYPYATGESRLWCDRLVRGLARHEFDLYALSRSARQERGGWIQLPPHVRRVRTAPLWAPADDGRTYGRRDRRRFAAHFGRLATGICATGSGRAGHGLSDGFGDTFSDTFSDGFSDDFSEGLYGLADLARERGGLYAALRSEVAVRILEAACRAPGARRGVQHATVPDYLAFADRLERALRPLSLPWYGDSGSWYGDGASGADRGTDPGARDGLGAVDLCHAASGGSAALPGLLAKRFFGVPLLVTEYGVRLRAHYLATGGPDAPFGDSAEDPGSGAPLRTLLAAFEGLLAAEVYRRADLVTPGNTHARRWQERCGADRTKLRTVYPGMEAERFSTVGEAAGKAGHGGDPGTLVWVGRIEPAKDLISLLHAFAQVRRAEPGARLRIMGAAAEGAEAAAYLAHCRALADRLFPGGAADAHPAGEHPVSFEEIGGPGAPELPDAYAAGGVVVLSSVVEGFPVSLVEAMFCGRATVSTDVGAVVEIVGGTGLVVPPRNPRALADACVALLRDPERRERLGAVARARALELFTVEQNRAAFHGIYLELISRAPVHRPADTVDAAGSPLPFARPAEGYVPGRWTTSREPVGARAGAGGLHV
ncbi:glycosyltransferase [Streptomyces sp. NPDC087420]|uniref:glycosyltransferase n=1 Tax=Streptomyces sp. NPDC087420 TaxID=3365785 RepID=UPI0038333C9C